nr:MAG TPA: YT521-B-like domain protein [Caudoviricetes sp.]
MKATVKKTVWWTVFRESADEIYKFNKPYQTRQKVYLFFSLRHSHHKNRLAFC